MKHVVISVAILSATALIACHASKKTASKTLAAPAPAVAAAPPSKPATPPADGIFEPGAAELAVLQMTYSDVTMAQLKEGYTLYTGVCTNCHAAKSIYDRPREAWPAIVNSMAREANITDAQKKSLYSYILAIKGTQPAK